MQQFDQIYAENYRLVFNVVQKMISDKDDVLDLVQEVFISLFQNLERGTPIEYPRSWLYKVTVNKCIDFTRKQTKHEAIESCISLKDEDKSLETRETQDVIRLAMSKLNKEERILAVLYSEGLSYKELSEITGIRYSSVGKTLSRTLSKLGNELKKCQYELY